MHENSIPSLNRDVDNISDSSSDTSNQGDQYPALGGIEQALGPAPEAFTATQLFQAEGIAYAVLYPVGTRVLIVPHAVVVVDGIG